MKTINYLEFEEYISILAEFFPKKKDFYDSLRYAIDSDNHDVVDDIWSMEISEFKRRVKKYRKETLDNAKE